MVNLVKGMSDIEQKVLIVEGINDRRKVQQVLDEAVTIICTHGTLSNEKLENLIIPIEDYDVYIFVDSDDAGNSLRKQLKRELPHATHIYTRKEYGQVENTPLEYVSEILRAYFNVK